MYWNFTYKMYNSLQNLQDLVAGFDQEAAAAVMARLVSFKMEAEVLVLPI